MLRRRRTNPQNLWALLALPFIGAAGWVIYRIFGRHKPSPAITPIYVNEPVVDRTPALVQEPAHKTVQAVTETRPTAESRAVKSYVPFFVLLVPFLIIPVVIVTLAFRHIPEQSQPVVPNGDARQGQALLTAWGCGACHTIRGIPGADGKVGPVLSNISERSYIAGRLPNNADNLVMWIMHPQEIAPGVDMPDSNVPEGAARNMAAYLYSLP